MEWLRDESYRPLFVMHGVMNVTLLKAPKNTDFDYLYLQRNYTGGSLVQNEDFEYAGIFCRQDGVVYDGHGRFHFFIEGIECPLSMEQMGKELEENVQMLVETTLANDPGNLSVTTLSPARQNEYERYMQDHLLWQARSSYLYDTMDSDTQFRCAYRFDQWSEEAFLNYILDPNGMTERLAQAYIANNQEDMLLQFLEKKALADTVRGIAAEPESPLHRIKAILQAVETSGAKSVHVTVLKDGQEFTFKTGTEQLVSNHSSYSSWYIPAPERREFEKLFGRYASYFPDEITKITFGRNMLYEADPPEPIKDENESMGMSL
mgnify:CR=1 FL=1